MSYPENFTDGEIPDEHFRWAYDSAVAKRTRVGISIQLQKRGIPEEIVERHLDEILKAGKKERTRDNRGHIYVGWGITIFGALLFVAMLSTGYLSLLGLGMTASGVIYLYVLKD